MPFLQSRLFFRIISKSREVYVLKIITLAIAFACTTLITLFSLNEFGYDRFHSDYSSIFRILQRNSNEHYNGNRLSNRIPFKVYSRVKTQHKDSIIVSRVKLMEELSVHTMNQHLRDQKIHAVDPELTKIFSVDILDGGLTEFNKKERTALLSSRSALAYFGTERAAGKKIKISSLGDTIEFKVAAVYRDFPSNSHEQFNAFIRFDTSIVRSLCFNPNDAGVYGKVIHRNLEGVTNTMSKQEEQDLIYKAQPISEIYFGPRVLGEDARHGDEYSIVILICITVLILFLALTSFINLTTLTLPHRSKELAIKKLAGTNQWNLLGVFAMESFSIVGISLVLGILLLLLVSRYIEPILIIDPISLLWKGDALLLLILIILFVLSGIAPLFMTVKFAKATPTRLLSTETITFPRFKKTIIILQLGISIFLIVASMVISRQVNYSLIKEPGRNHDQVVYVSYPKDLTNEGLISMRAAWKKINANIVDIMGTSQLPNRINSKELHSEFYFMSVDRDFKDFFNLNMVEGNWFKVNDGDSILVINEKGRRLLGKNTPNVAGVFEDMSGQFNQPEKAIKINPAPYFNYNFLCVRVLEVDIRRTMNFLSNYFRKGDQPAKVTYMSKRFEEWLSYQDRLNALSKVLAIISGVLSCFAIYGLSIGIVRDKLKQIAIHKLCGASILNITRLLVLEFTKQMFIAILIFGPATYIILSELLRTFVYITPFQWLDPLLPLAYCASVITLLCGFQALSLNREDLSGALKGH